MAAADDPTRRVAEHYSAQAEEFARYWAPTLGSLAQRLLSALPLSAAARVVDVGAGTGGLLPAIRAAAPAALVVGVDVAEGMLRVARRETGGPLALMDAQRLAFREGAFDVALSAFVMHRVLRPGDAVTAMRRVVRPGGAIGTVTWARGTAARASTIWHEELDRHSANSPGATIDHHGLVDEPAKLEALFHGAGLADVRAWIERVERRPSRAEWLDLQVNRQSRARLASLSPSARAVCIDRATARLAALPPDDFASVEAIVLAVGRRPEAPSPSGRGLG